MPLQRTSMRVQDEDIDWDEGFENEVDTPARSSKRIQAKKDLERLKALSRRRTSGRVRSVQQPQGPLPLLSAAHRLHSDLAKNGLHLNEDDTEDKDEEPRKDSACDIVKDPPPKAQKRSAPIPATISRTATRSDDPPSKILRKAKEQVSSEGRPNYPRLVPEEYFSLDSSPSIRSVLNDENVVFAQDTQMNQRSESSETDEEESVFTPSRSRSKPQSQASGLTKVPAYGSKTLQITICFLRNDKNQLFEPGLPLSASEIFIQHAATLEPSMISKHGRRPHRYGETLLHREVEDQFFTGIIRLDDDISVLLAQIRRLLNVYFSHPEPERLELWLKVYDENHPGVGAVFETNYRRQTRQTLGLSSLVQTKSKDSYPSARQELLVVVHKLRRSTEFDLCPRSSWVNIEDPITWTLSNQYRREGETRLRSKTFWQHAISTRRQRTVLDMIPTQSLPRQARAGRTNEHTTLHMEDRHAVLYGLGMEE